MNNRPLTIYVSWLIRKGYSGFAFWPFIFLRGKEAAIARIIDHERIHLRQQLELLVLPFYILYFSEYLIRRFQYPTWREAYENISFEREAYAHELDRNYLNKRRFWAWLKYYN